MESTLRPALAEFLNAEIVLGTVGDISTAVEWLKSTYYHVRVRKAPQQYGVPQTVIASCVYAQSLEIWLRDKVLLSIIHELSRHGLVQSDEDGFSLQAMEPGVIMAENYVKLQTMIDIMQCPSGGKIADILWILARCHELSSIKLRRNEKSKLNALNKNAALKYHVMATGGKKDRIVNRISTAADKIFILVSPFLFHFSCAATTITYII